MAVYNISFPSDRALFPTLFARADRGENLWQGKTAEEYRQVIAEEVQGQLASFCGSSGEDEDEDLLEEESYEMRRQRVEDQNTRVFIAAQSRAYYVLSGSDPDSFPVQEIPLWESSHTRTLRRRRGEEILEERKETKEKTVSIRACSTLYPGNMAMAVEDYVKSCGRERMSALKHRRKATAKAYRGAKRRSWGSLVLLLLLMCVTAAVLGGFDHPTLNRIVADSWGLLSTTAQERILYGVAVVMILLLLRFIHSLFRRMDTDLEKMRAEDTPDYDEEKWFGEVMPKKQAAAAKCLPAVWRNWRYYCCMTSYIKTGRLDRYTPDNKDGMDVAWRELVECMEKCRALLARGAL